jgi:hypothetical protein
MTGVFPLFPFPPFLFFFPFISTGHDLRAGLSALQPYNHPVYMSSHSGGGGGGGFFGTQLL